MAAKEPKYIYSDEQVMGKSNLAKNFMTERKRLGNIVSEADNNLVKRFYNIDHNVYMEEHLPSKYKELMGLVGSATLRCDDCINYHIVQAYKLGASRKEVEESFNIALVVGGSIVIPHMRRAYALLAELWPYSQIEE